jgi:uncharacterized membrane protein YphA (DoxX/SURF4 family)
MNTIKTLACQLHSLLNQTRHADFLAPLALRLFLVPIFWMAGTKKINFETLLPYESTVQWFGNPDWGLGMPFPELMAFMAGWTEILGAAFLAVGFALRYICVPLMVTMIVAAVSVHWDFGWQAISDPGAPFVTERVNEAAERLSHAKSILQEHGNYHWLTGRGSLAILNNGIEFSVTYFIMLLSLFFTGAGRFVSLDFWIEKFAQK